MSYKIAVIGDPETVIGFSLAGVSHTHVYRDKNKALGQLEEFLNNREIGLILITHRVVESLGPEFHQVVRKKGLIPLVLKIPDKTGYSPEKDELSDLVRRSVGIEIPVKTEGE